MNPKIILCLALVLSGGFTVVPLTKGSAAVSHSLPEVDPATGLPVAGSPPQPELTNSADYIERTKWFQKPGVGISLAEFQAAVREYQLGLSKSTNAPNSPTNTQQSFEPLLHSIFPGKKWEDAIDRLPLAQRNQLAVTAARELSLSTTNGDILTNGETDLIQKKPLSSRTVAEEALVQLNSDNLFRVEFLHEMAGLGLVTDQNVIPPLIEMLDEPIDYVRDEASGTLSLLTWRLRDINTRNDQRPEQIAAWWREWWVKNHTKKYLLYDAELESLVNTRIKTIAWCLRLNLRSYSELEISEFGDPELPDDEVTACQLYHDDNSSAGNSASPPFLIAASFLTPSLFPYRDGSPRYGGYPTREPKTVEILREEISGTDLAITVRAATEDNNFVALGRRSLKKLPPMPRSAAEAIQQLETVKKPEVIRLSKLLKNESSADEATRDLIEIDAEGSVINALTNSSPAIRRNIFSALANERLSEAAAPALIFLLKDNDPETRSAAIQVLGQIQGKDAIRLPALIQMLGEQNEDVRLATLSALEEMMSATLRDEDPAITPSAYKRQATNLVPAMVQSLSDTNADVREKAVEALGNLGMIRNGKDEQAVAALTGALADADLKVRTAAVKALKYFGAAAKEALPALSQFTGETNSALSTAAADSYKTINADVKTKEQEALVAEKYPRLVMKGGVGAIKKMDSTHWVGETNVAPGIKSPPMLIKKATFELLTPSTDPVAAKMLNEKIDPPEHLADVPIVAFKIPQSGKVWIGWQMDFYVETESNIIGGMLTYWGYVNWHTNLAVEPFNEDLDTVIDHFEKRISGSNLPGTGNRQTDIDGVTRGRSPLLERLYEIPGGAKRVMPQFVGLDVATNTLRLDLENPDTGRQASYWIDLKTRKVGDFTVRDN